MKRFVLGFGGVAVASATVLALSAAQRPAALSVTSPGLWEIDGLPGARVRPRRCIADTVNLARIEHQGEACTHVVVSDERSRAVIHYTCASGGFGQTEIDVLTPRSLRIETQGISRKAPFHYIVQARRLGACAVH